MTRNYRTKNIEQAATIQAVTGIAPQITFDGSGLATFEYPMDQQISEVVLHYESGIRVDARSLLTIRNQLYKRIKGGC